MREREWEMGRGEKRICRERGKMGRGRERDGELKREGEDGEEAIESLAMSMHH